MLERLSQEAPLALVPTSHTSSPAVESKPVGLAMQSRAIVIADSTLPACTTPRVLTKADVLRELDRYATWVKGLPASGKRDTQTNQFVGNLDAQYTAILASREVGPFTAPTPEGTPESVAAVLAVMTKHPIGAQPAVAAAASAIADTYNAIATVEVAHEAAARIPRRSWLSRALLGKETKSQEAALADAYRRSHHAYFGNASIAVSALASFNKLIETYLSSTQLLPSVALRAKTTERAVLIQNLQQRISELTAIKTQLVQEGQYAVAYATQGNAQPAQRLITSRQSFLVRFEAIDLQLGAILNELEQNVGSESLRGVMPEFGPLQQSERLKDPADLKGAHGWCIEGAAICDHSMKALNEVLNELNAAQARDTADIQRFSTTERQVVRAAALADI